MALRAMFTRPQTMSLTFLLGPVRPSSPSSARPAQRDTTGKSLQSSGIQYFNFTVVSTSHLPGGSQFRNYFFKAVQPGSQTITMQDQRVFAPYNTRSTVSIRVSVS